MHAHFINSCTVNTTDYDYEMDSDMKSDDITDTFIDCQFASAEEKCESIC